MRRKRGLFIGWNDGDDDPGAPYSLPPTRSRSDARVDGSVMHWLADPVGEALLKLAEDGFDFSKPGLVEFIVNFRNWPPPRGAMACLSRAYPSASVCVTDDDRDGYLEFQVYALVSFELVTNIQSYVTELMSPYRGICSSWDVVRSSPSLEGWVSTGSRDGIRRGPAFAIALCVMRRIVHRSMDAWASGPWAPADLCRVLPGHPSTMLDRTCCSQMLEIGLAVSSVCNVTR